MARPITRPAKHDVVRRYSRAAGIIKQKRYSEFATFLSRKHGSIGERCIRVFSDRVDYAEGDDVYDVKIRPWLWLWTVPPNVRQTNTAHILSGLLTPGFRLPDQSLIWAAILAFAHASTRPCFQLYRLSEWKIMPPAFGLPPSLQRSSSCTTSDLCAVFSWNRRSLNWQKSKQG